MCGTTVGAVGTNFRRHVNVCSPLVYDALDHTTKGAYFQGLSKLLKSNLIQKYDKLDTGEYLRLIRKVMKVQPNQEKNVKRRAEPLHEDDPVVSGIVPEFHRQESELLAPAKPSTHKSTTRPSRRKRRRIASSSSSSSSSENRVDDAKSNENDDNKADAHNEDGGNPKVWRKRRRLGDDEQQLSNDPEPEPEEPPALSAEAVAATLLRFRALEQMRVKADQKLRLKAQQELQIRANALLRQHLQKHPFSQDNLMDIVRDTNARHFVNNHNLLKEAIRPQNVTRTREELDKCRKTMLEVRHHLKRRNQELEKNLRNLSMPSATLTASEGSVTDSKKKSQRLSRTNISLHVVT